MEISNLTDADFKTLVIRMFKEHQQYKKNPGRNEGYTK